VVVMAKTGRDAATRGVDRILSALRRNGLQSSIGVAMFPGDGTDGQTLFFAADEALYQAKQSGKNCYRFYLRGSGAHSPEEALRALGPAEDGV
jgi:GGDEF domain-containing protein